jgi:hypothetical protein
MEPNNAYVQIVMPEKDAERAQRWLDTHDCPARKRWEIARANNPVWRIVTTTVGTIIDLVCAECGQKLEDVTGIVERF